MHTNPYQPPQQPVKTAANPRSTSKLRQAAIALFCVWQVLAFSRMALRPPEIPLIVDQGLQATMYLALIGSLAGVAIDRLSMHPVTWAKASRWFAVATCYLLPSFGIGTLVFALTASLPWAYVACLAVMAALAVAGVMPARA